MEGHTEPVALAVDTTRSVSGLWRRPPKARACFVLAHGAGAGMTHPFLEAIADGLADRGVASLRYQFPFMEQGSRRPDPPKLAHATVRAAVAAAGRLAPNLPLIAGGRSFGGRMTSQAQTASPLPGVQGLAFLGFPLHPAGDQKEGLWCWTCRVGRYRLIYLERYSHKVCYGTTPVWRSVPPGSRRSRPPIRSGASHRASWRGLVCSAGPLSHTSVPKLGKLIATLCHETRRFR